MARVQQVQHVFWDVMKIARSLFPVQKWFSQCWTFATIRRTLKTHPRLTDMQTQALSCQQILCGHNLTVCLIWILTPVTSDPVHVNIITHTHSSTHTHKIHHLNSTKSVFTNLLSLAGCFVIHKCRYQNVFIKINSSCSVCGNDWFIWLRESEGHFLDRSGVTDWTGGVSWLGAS